MSTTPVTGEPSPIPPSAYDSIASHKTLFGHPAGLFVLFFTEMWERFSYYGMRSLLMLYMLDYLFKNIHAGKAHVIGFGGLERGLVGIFGPMNDQPLASQIYGLYTAFVYFMTLFGGILADRWLGQRKTVVVGAVTMAIGHFLMALEPMFLIALLCLILGNGCFKPNTSAQVGNLYAPGDPRRDRAYTIYYCGVNLGAFLAPLVCGTLGQVYGWHYGFTAAGVGMILGLCVYLWGQRFLAKDQLSRTRAANSAPVPRKEGEGKAIAGLVFLMLLTAIFWAIYEQQGNTLQVFADRNADWHVFGWQMPSTWFQAVNPLFIFTFTPLLNMFWNRQARRGTEPSSVYKIALGCIFAGISFLPLIYIARGLTETQRISFLWLVGSTAILTLGELYLSPIGLSLVSKVSPARLVGMMMGMWFMANFIGNYLTGYLGTFYEKMSHPSFFTMLGLLAAGSGLVIFALSKPLRNAVGRDV